nr:MAG TPA: hypothetical protein [Caudoviricetes sp.]
MHQRCNFSILTYAENNGNHHFPLFFLRINVSQNYSHL